MGIALMFGSFGLVVALILLLLAIPCIKAKHVFVKTIGCLLLVVAVSIGIYSFGLLHAFFTYSV